MAFDAYGAVLGRVLYPAWERLRGRPTFPLLHQLQRSERLSLDELTAQRTGYLRRLIRHASACAAPNSAFSDGCQPCLLYTSPSPRD